MLKVFPATINEKDSLLFGQLCTLPYAVQDKVSQKINGDWCLKFQYPQNRMEAMHIKADNLVLVQGQLYRIRRVKQVCKVNQSMLEVEAPHIVFDLQNYVIENIETDMEEGLLDGIDAEQALKTILQDTPFRVGKVDVDLSHKDYLNILQKDVMHCLKEEIVKKWGGELQFDNFTISLLHKIGKDKKMPLRSGKNITSIQCTEDVKNVVTRLHIIGYNGADIKDINEGKDYIDSVHINKYSHIMEGYATFSDEDDAQALLTLGQAHLKKVEVPQISYEISLSKLKSTLYYTFYAPFEQFELGDTAVLHHEMLGADVCLRCKERVFEGSTNINQTVKFGSSEDVIESTLSAGHKANNAINKVIAPSGNVRAEKLSGIIDGLKTCLYASSAYQTAEVKENQGVFLVNDALNSPSYGALYLGPGMFAIANQKDAKNAWKWRTFGNGSGFNADEITAGTLSAARIDINSLDLSGNVEYNSVIENLKGMINLRVTETTFQESVEALENKVHETQGSAENAQGTADSAGEKADEANTKADEVQNDVQEIVKRTTAIEQTSSKIELSVSEMSTTVNGVKQEQEELKTYMRLTEDGLEIGKTNSRFKTFQDDAGYHIKENGVDVARFTNNTMYNSNAEIEDSLTVGNYSFVKTKNGGLGILWK